jgi:outer membrane protein TolC
MKFFVLFILLATSGIRAEAPEEVVKLRAQDVIDLLLKNSDELKNIEQDARQSTINLLRIKSSYDMKLDAGASYEHSRVDSISGTQNIEDRNIRYEVEMEQSFQTGTRLALSYERLHQNSKLEGFSEGLRDPNQVYDGVFLTLRQNLLQNALGLAERARKQSAELAVAKSGLTKKETAEIFLLEALGLFWSAYMAREDFRYAMLARDRYVQLGENLASKVKRELAERSDLLRVEAEIANKQREVQALSLIYLNLLEELHRTLKIDGKIELEVSSALSDLPESEFSFPDNRVVQAAQLSAEQAELEVKAAKWSTLPTLETFGVAGYTGVGRGGSDSFSRVAGADRPVYEIGLSLSVPLFSRAAKAEKLEAEINYRKAMNGLSLAKARSDTARIIARRNIQSSYVITQSAIKTFEARKKVVDEQEKRYRRGLISLSDLIQDHNFYYAAQSARSKAIADYNLAIVEWEAVQDQLVK